MATEAYRLAQRTPSSESYSLAERDPSPSDISGSRRGTPLADRNIVVIDGKRFRMQIRHKITGEIVTVPPHIWENIRPATEEIMNRMIGAAKRTGNHNNFQAKHIQKIQIDLSSEPYTIKYTSKASADTEEELEEAVEFTLDVSPTDARIHQHAIHEFGKISHVVSSAMAPPRPIRASRPDEEQTVSGSRLAGHSIEATIGRLRRGEPLTSDDLMNYSSHVIQRLNSKALHLERNIDDPQLLHVDGDGKVKIFSDSSEREQAIKREFERGNREAPLVIYLHHGERNQHFSVLIAKDGNLFAYNPTGVPHTPALNLKAIFKGIYGREPGTAEIFDYNVKPQNAQIFHTVCETFKTGNAEQDAEMRQRVWYMILYMDQDGSTSPVELTEVAIYATLGDTRYGTVHEAVQQARDADVADINTKIKNMIKAAGINAGQVDAHFDNGAHTAVREALIHQRDRVSCGPLVLLFAEQICTQPSDVEDAYRHFVSIPGSTIEPARLRQHLADRLAEVQRLEIREQERASRLLSTRDIESRRVIGSRPQFGVHQGLARASCAVMSLVALEKMRVDSITNQEDIDTVLAVGSDLYGKILDQMAHRLIQERDAGEANFIRDYFAGIGKEAPVLPAESPETHEQRVREALHGVHLHWGEIHEFLPHVVGHDLRTALGQYNITSEVTTQLGGDQSDETRYQALMAPLVAAATAEKPSFGLLTLGAETYAVRVFIHEGRRYIDFVNSHGEAQLDGKAARRTFTPDAFIADLVSRHPQVEPRANDYNRIGLVRMTLSD